MKNITKHYRNDDLEVTWQPEKCIHSAICATKLGEVFSPNKRPWINMDGSDSKSIAETVSKCPSGALSIKNEDAAESTTTDTGDSAIPIKLIQDGPLLVAGEVAITLSDGSRKTATNPALCRCGASNNKPFCDGSHMGINFKT